MQQFTAEVRRHTRTFLIAIALSAVRLGLRARTARAERDPDQHDLLAHL